MCFIAEKDNIVKLEIHETDDISKDFLKNIGLIEKDNSLTVLGKKLYKVMEKDY